MIYDPLSCVTGNQGCKIIRDSTELYEESTGNIVFNLSYETIDPVNEALFVFDFNLKAVPSGNTFYYINNPDGSMRWIYPSSVKVPYFLDLYNSGSLKGSVYKHLVKMAFCSGLRRSVSSGQFTLQQKIKNKVEEVIESNGEVGYSIFTGTVGENRKSIISLHRNRQTSHYIKIAFNEQPRKLIKNEWTMLTTLSKYDFTALSLPQVSVAIDPNFVKVSNVKPGITISANRLRDVHLKALGELYMTNHENRKIADTPAWKTISNQLNLLDKEHDILNDLDATLVYGIIQRLFELHNSIDTETIIPVSFAHGDFTPWNMYTDDHRLYVYDWELAGAGMPMLVDLFHFVFQSQVLIYRKDISAISNGIAEVLENEHCRGIINRYKIDTSLHYRLYLLFNISYYIRLYMNQRILHPQAHWLVNTWFQALKEIK